VQGLTEAVKRTPTRGASTTNPPAPAAIAEGVYWLPVGRGLMRSNVYFVRAGPSWALVDTGSQGCATEILAAASTLFGSHAPPAAILLTHSHADHAGSARELTSAWGCPLHLHPDELPLARGDLAAVRRYPNPLDRWLILPILRLLPLPRRDAIVAASSLADLALPFDPKREPPGLPGWRCVPSPGHTPGHVAYFRPNDRVLLTGDAIVTVDLNSLPGILFRKPCLSPPPRYVTWDWKRANDSVASLARLQPRVLAGGHGAPASGAALTADLRTLARSPP
jgi:glyoxylase-like metal-dependent hydrolase (beta-lactamase superfamily II)